jgi:vacuolar-type H+-ATPase subunit E/Vma4
MAGVAPPTDPEAARLSELAPLFVTLDAVQREVDAIVEAGGAEAERIQSQAAADAEAVVARAMERAVAVKTRESQRRLDRSATERDARIAAGEAQAATIRMNADARAAAVANAVVQHLARLAVAGGAAR